MDARIAISGIGLVTPLGLTAAENLACCRTLESRIAPVRDIDTAGRAFRAAAYVPPFSVSDSLRYPKYDRFLSQPVTFAWKAAREALTTGGLDPARLDGGRIGLYAGAGQTGIEYDWFFPALSLAWEGDREMDFRYLGGRPSHLIDRYITLRTLANLGVGMLAAEFGIHGPSGNYVQYDTASAEALLSACGDLVEGRCDVALAGGYDSLLLLSNFLAYEKAGLLSRAAPDIACRPYDRDRDGLVLGQGAAFLLLERWEDAEKRGAPIVGELCGVGCAMETSDAWRLGWDPDTLCAAVHEACGGESPDFVVGHGLATREEDAREAAAISRLLDDIPVTAFKSRTGYLGAATAAVELGLGLLCAREGFLPAIVRHETADPECPLALVTREARPLLKGHSLGLYLCAAWGGQIAALAARAA
ncbi:MAG TPA: beta-ketoacyl synthase N-terminal-like domain-containing protein [Bryobacteraceae bacterium]|nr:beta-ketoacyl synthase N-terminal-like domain-containing protein [Bryobacteraceae bacterium]